MALPALPDDVFYMILEELEQQADVSAFMRSSWSFYALGINRLLAIGVSIRPGTKLISFCRFMKRILLDVPVRDAKQVHNFTISFAAKRGERYRGEQEQSSTEEHQDDHPIEALHAPLLLVPILKRLTTLQRLEISCCETLLERDERLVYAFAGLTTLQELHISDYGPLTENLITNLRSHLSEVYLDYTSRVNGMPIRHYDGLSLPDPLTMLRRHRDTLQRATIFLGCLIKEALCTVDAVYPHVRTVALSRCQLFERKVVVNAFPNISALEAFWMEPRTVRSHPGDGPSAQEVRAVNASYAKQWERLDFVHADVETLYTLALKCPVRRLDVTFWEFDNEDIEYLCMTLPDVRPQCLVLQWGYWDCRERVSIDLSPELLLRLADGLREPVISGITHFGLDISLRRIEDNPVHYMDAITTLLGALQGVCFFSFRLHAVSPEYEDEFEDSTLGDEDQILDVLSAFDDDLVHWAQEIADATQALAVLCFFVMGRRAFWRISQRGNLRFLQSIEPEEGERIMASAEMTWHHPAKSLWQGTPNYIRGS